MFEQTIFANSKKSKMISSFEADLSDMKPMPCRTLMTVSFAMAADATFISSFILASSLAFREWAFEVLSKRRNKRKSLLEKKEKEEEKKEENQI